MVIIDHRKFGDYDVETIVVDDQSSFTIACSPRRFALPSNGGIRWYRYTSLGQQKDEAIMLAHAMDLKHDLYRTGFSGGKIVVNSKVGPDEAPHVLDAIGKALNHYRGSMYTGCDVNTSSMHMAYLRKSTPWILNAMENPLVNTSVATGYGVWSAMQAVLQFSLGSSEESLIAIHGLGKVGCELARQCLTHGHKVVGFDTRLNVDIPDGVTLLSEEAFWSQSSDVLCIASLSGVLDIPIVDRIRTQWLISSANAPFTSPEAQAKLIANGVKYLPDYVSNAGAVICDSVERTFPDIFSTMTQARANEYAGALIGTKTKELLERSRLLGCDISTLLSHTH